MSVDTYPYSEWTQWPEEDVREWAEELASAFNLEKFEAKSLLEDMLVRAGHWRDTPESSRYPVKMTEETEASYTAAYVEWHATRTEAGERPNSVALEIFEQNRRLNRPWQRPAFVPTKWERKRVVGSGLSSRTYWEAKREGAVLQESRRASASSRKLMAKRPLRYEERGMTSAMHEWLWQAGCVRLTHIEGRWMVPESQEAERDGMWWYYEAVNSRLEMARRQVASGEAERAAWHSLHAGRLFAEMELKATHDEFFKKAQRTREAQSDVGRANRKLPPEVLKASWWKYRREGYSSTEAGIQAGNEYGVSERTVRRAFDDEYPELAEGPRAPIP